MGKQKILINRKTGKEFSTTDPDKVLKKYPKAFRIKPDTKLNKDVESKEAEILSNTVSDLEGSLKNVDSLDELNRQLDSEKNGQNRKTAISAIESRIKEVESDNSSTKN